MKSRSDFLICCLLFFNFLFLKVSEAQPSIFNNNGALISITEDALVIAQNSTVTNFSGTIGNAGLFIIEGDFVNSGTASGNGGAGHYRVLQNWENNAVFIPDFSEVELYGDNQLITGTSVTTFYNLNLTGTGIKTMTIDAEANNTLNLNDVELATDASTMFVTNTAPASIQRATGFVSSLGDGRLSRETNSTVEYLYPVGSSIGIARYRPVVLTPTSSIAHTFAIRMANVDPTSEGYDRNETDDICLVNPEFYHLIDKTSGSDPVTIKVYYDPAQDGDWNTNAHWQNLPQWINMANSTQGTDAPFAVMTTSNWNNFSFPAFALANKTFEAESFATDVSCFGFDDGIAEVIVADAQESLSYAWSNDGEGKVQTNLSPGVYTVIITDANDCELAVNITINEPQELEVSIDFPFYEISTGEDVQINTFYSPASQNVEYTWTPAITLDCINCPSVIASPSENTTYKVTVVNENGCLATDETLVIIRGEEAFYIPNAFSPNNDSNNDIFKVYGNEITALKMKIFDRWGEIIFISDDINQGWDGTFKGLEAPVGLYVYVVEVAFTNGKEKLESGSLTLLR